MRAGGTIFELVSDSDFVENLPNFGDVSLRTGMAALLADCHQGQIIRDDWKSFPWLTWARLCAAGVTSVERYQRWHELESSRRKSLGEQLIANSEHIRATLTRDYRLVMEKRYADIQNV